MAPVTLKDGDRTVARDIHKQMVWRWHALGRRTFGRILRPLLRVEAATILRCDLTRPMPETVAAAPLEAFVASRREVLEEVAKLRQPLDASLPRLFARRLDNGFICFIGRVEGRLVAYNWTQYAPGEDAGNYIDLRPDEVHCADAYTAEAFRGKNIHAALLREMLLFSCGLGYRYAYSRVSLTNRRSPKAHRRLGWETTGRVLRATWYGGPVVRLSGSAHPWRRLGSGDVGS